jgi:hypothetical protein
MLNQGPPRRYYSERTGTNPNGTGLSLENLKALFVSAYSSFSAKGYWDQSFGYYCVDQGNVSGNVGPDMFNYVLFCLHKGELWPIVERAPDFSEDDVFDMIEFLHDHVSKPLDGFHHTFNDCGIHWNEFDKAAGQAEYRVWINRLLEKYGSRYELTTNGEVKSLGPVGISTLYDATSPGVGPTISSKIQAAVDRFRRHGSSIEDRHAAVRDLADILEYVRKEVKTVFLKKDESDLFELANNFGVRHFKDTQKLDYDKAIWLSWMFYYYLSTIHAFFHLAARQKKEFAGNPSSTLLVPERILDELRLNVPISKVVSRHVLLTSAGKERKGLCPFHKEKSPSFFINDDKGFYHCFGCGAHGDILSFVMRINAIDLSAAVRALSIEISDQPPLSG